MGVRLLTLVVLAVLVAAGCGDSEGGVIKPSETTKSPMAGSAEKKGP